MYPRRATRVGGSSWSDWSCATTPCTNAILSNDAANRVSVKRKRFVMVLIGDVIFQSGASAPAQHCLDNRLIQAATFPWLSKRARLTMMPQETCRCLQRKPDGFISILSLGRWVRERSLLSDTCSKAQRGGVNI